MKEFLKTNTITYNLMSFTGFKAMYIFSLLVDSPKSYQEIQEHFLKHEYIRENISKDAIRVYFNSLKEFGCNIEKQQIDGISKFVIDRHPFELKITDTQIKSLIKIYKAISQSVTIEELIALQKFIEKIAKFINDEKLKNKLQFASPLKNIKIKIIEDLYYYAKNNTEITILYNSPQSGTKEIILLVDKLEIKNNKLYVYGISSQHKSYSSFLVERINEIKYVNTEKKTFEIPKITVRYQYTQKDNIELELLDCEKIISKNGNVYLVELESKSKFDIIQRILSHTNKCKVLYPENIKTDVISELKKMKEGYLD